MAADTAAQAAWVKRVLGVDIAGPAVAAAPLDARAIWRDAKDEVDVRINALAGKLRATGHADLIRIADLGLFAITGGKTNVALNKALIEFTAASEGRRQEAGQTLRTAAQGYRAVLAGSEGVTLIDNNPFGVDVALRTRLGAALDRIERALP